MWFELSSTPSLMRSSISDGGWKRKGFVTFRSKTGRSRSNRAVVWPPFPQPGALGMYSKGDGGRSEEGPCAIL